jgi:hypothetical protein
MKRSLILLTALLVGTAAAMLGSEGVGQAQSPSRAAAHAVELEPVCTVSSASTLGDIQTCLDNGGTVYFQYGEYHQVESSAPDLPPSPANPPKSFSIGAYGRDVHIIGLPGPRGERPKIIGGAPTFRMGIFPVVGFYGLPASFRIENLEIFNPDRVYSYDTRVGIWVLDALGAETSIVKCRITVTGRDTDHPNNSSSAIFVKVQGAAPPPSGAWIEIANNEFVVAKTRMAVGVGHFWPDANAFMPPRLLVRDNVISVSSLRGGSQLGGAAAIVLHGNVEGAILVDNVLRGDGRLTGAENKGIQTISTVFSGTLLHPANLTVEGNDLSGFTGHFQVYFDPGVLGSRVAKNIFGPATGAGVKCDGHDNVFINNHFYGEYPGWSRPAGPGLFWFGSTSYSNRVVSTKLNEPPHGSDICDQVCDETGGTNNISGEGDYEEEDVPRQKDLQA